MAALWNRMIALTCRAVRWADGRLPRGVRSVAGLLLALGGVIGFLPILGFWMLPVGLVLIAMDVPALRARLLAWTKRHEAGPAAASGREAPQGDRNLSRHDPFKPD